MTRHYQDSTPSACNRPRRSWATRSPANNVGRLVALAARLHATITRQPFSERDANSERSPNIARHNSGPLRGLPLNTHALCQTAMATKRRTDRRCPSEILQDLLNAGGAWTDVAACPKGVGSPRPADEVVNDTPYAQRMTRGAEASIDATTVARTTPR